MAVTTYTSTTFANSAMKAVHVANQSVSGQFVWGATSTVGDVAFLCKVPHGATVVDIIVDHSTGASTQALSYGLARGAAAGGGGNLSCFIASGAQGSVLRKTVVGLPVTVSVSDTDPLRYGEFACKVESGTTTTSLFVNFTIIYRSDGT
jgi:hypothetical protein